MYRLFILFATNTATYLNQGGHSCDTDKRSCGISNSFFEKSSAQSLFLQLFVALLHTRITRWPIF